MINVHTRAVRCTFQPRQQTRWECPAVVRELRDAAQAEGLNCIQTLIAIRDNPNFPPITRIAACNSLLDRGYGRPVQGLAIQNLPALPDPKTITSEMTFEEAAQVYADTIKGVEQLVDQTNEQTIIDVPSEDDTS
jgi:hypothetical protein